MVVATTVSDVTSIVTMAAAGAAVVQLQLARRQLRLAFERTFVDRYEEIIGRIRLPIILGDLPMQGDEETERAFFDYFELCEEELYYRRAARVSRTTWKDWREGICVHMRRKSFARAWTDLNARLETRADSNRVRVKQFALLERALPSLTQGVGYDPKLSWFRRQLERLQA